MSDPATIDGLMAYMQARDNQRLQAVGQMFENLSPRERLLVKEAAVMGFFQGQLAAGPLPRGEYPGDRDVLFKVLDGARGFSDLYPTLAKLDRVPKKKKVKP